MDVREDIRLFIMEELKEANQDGDVEYLEDEASLIEGGIMDSFMILSLIAFLEEKYGLILPKDQFDPENFETIKKISALVARRIAKS